MDMTKKGDFSACLSPFCAISAARAGGSELKTALSVAAPEEGGGSVLEQKERVRSSLLMERDAQLLTPAVRAFVLGMEQRRLSKQGWTSIFSVMRDGRELAKSLREIRALPDGVDRHAQLRKVIDPYLQVVDGEGVCAETGLRLADIWRYFRHTWATPYSNAPGWNSAFWCATGR